jgi:hypothetical protein
MLEAAAEFFGVDPLQIEVEHLRRLRRMRVRFTPTVTTTAPEQRRAYGDVNNRPNGNGPDGPPAEDTEVFR